jgi:hypothetical protein
MNNYLPDPSKESAIKYALEAIKICEEKIIVEGPNGSLQWQSLKELWQKHLETVKKL